MSTPTDRLPTWGTKATVDTGPDTGLTTRLEPSSDDKANGYVADQGISARVDNWLKGVTLDWLAHLAPIQLRNWRREFNSFAVTGATAAQVNTTAVFTTSGWVVPGSDAGQDDTATAYWFPAPRDSAGEMSNLAWVQATGAANFVSAAYSPASGTVMLGTVPNAAATNTVVWTMGEGGAGLAETELSASAGGAGRVVYESVTGRFLAFDHRSDGWQTGKKYYILDGSTWTEKTISGAATGHDILCVEAGGGEIVVTLADSNGIRTSTDGGETWVLGGTSGTAGVTGICYTGNGWMAIDDDGQVYRKLGDLWIAAGSPLAGTHYGETDNVAHDSYIYYGNHMASDGSRVVVVPFAVSGRGHGVYWTQDYGTTWHTEWLEQGLSANFQVRGVRYGGGEFLLIVRAPNLAGSAVVTEIWRSLRL